MERRNTEAAGQFFVPDLCGPRQVLFIVLLAELLVLVHVLALSRLPSFEWQVLASSSLFVQWTALLSAAALCRLRTFLARLQRGLATACALGLVLLVTALVSLAAGFFLPSPGALSPGYDLLRNLLVALVVAGIVLRYFYLQWQLRLREQSELQARLDALRARIRPHFLFNTLNSIASLIAVRPAEAERAVEDLAALFRASLQERDEHSTLADERRLCECYLAIEALRLGERLKVEWCVDAGLESLPMPALILQPLLENAVYHGVARLPEGGLIRVRISRESNALEVEVSNPLALDESPGGGLHMALENIEQRLEVLYGEAGSLHCQRDGGLFRVRLRYPLESLS